MTTQSWSSRIRHDSDAVFREWGAELNAKLSAVGLVQTSDTGQINWATVLKPGTNTDAGYEIWRFNDSLQATAPIYIRFDFGTTATAVTQPRIKATVGTGTNGAGTLTGTALTTARIINGNLASTSDTARQSYMCCVSGFFGMNWKVGAASCASFFVARTVDSAGAPTATGAMVNWSSGQATAITARQALRFAATAAAFTAQTTNEAAALGMNYQAPTSTLVGADIQVAVAWTITPRVEPLVGVCGVLKSEAAAGGTFSFTPVGATSRTYLTWSDEGGPFSAINVSTAGGLSVAMLWE